MAANGKVYWTITPSGSIAKRLAVIPDRAVPAIKDLAKVEAARGEAGMKQRAGWTDRTAHARNSLFGRAEETTIYLGTTNLEYGMYLEQGTRHMRAFPTIQPQANETAKVYFEGAAQLVKRSMG